LRLGHYPRQRPDDPGPCDSGIPIAHKMYVWFAKRPSARRRRHSRGLGSIGKGHSRRALDRISNAERLSRHSSPRHQHRDRRHVVRLRGLTIVAVMQAGSVDDNILANDSVRPCRRSHTGRRSCLFPLDCVEQAVEVVEIGRVAAYPGHVPAIQYTPAQHCCPCRLDCSIKNVFELGHYTGFLIRSFEPTRAR
jgi:hypothetical protein